MGVRPELWREWHDPKALPPWPCPRCRHGTLALREETWAHRQSEWDARLMRGEVWWEPDMMRRSACAILACSAAGCGESVAMAGELVPLEDPDHERQVMDYTDMLAPRTFYPAPTVFPLAEACPASVGGHVRRASAAFWTDRRSSIGALRATVEALLTDRGVRRSKRMPAKGAKPSYMKRLSLHERIEEFGVKEPEAADLLMAVKWLGNHGAHDGPEPDRDATLDAFELVEHVIERVYVRGAEALRRKAEAVTKRKGRPKAKKRAALSF